MPIKPTLKPPPATRPGQAWSTSALVWALTAAALLLGSAVLQLAASLQRWVTFRGSGTPAEYRGEDHLYDYVSPSDPWVPIGTAAQVVGAGLLVQALGILALTVGVLVWSAAVARRRGLLRLGVVLVLAVAAAAGVGSSGAHALVSGLTGAPSTLGQPRVVLELVSLAGLIGLAVLWRRAFPAASVACVFLLGSTALGPVFAGSFAALFAGYVSHDTTPWTETVIAATTALAGIAVLVGIRSEPKLTRKTAPAPTAAPTT